MANGRQSTTNAAILTGTIQIATTIAAAIVRNRGTTEVAEALDIYRDVVQELQHRADASRAARQEGR